MQMNPIADSLSYEKSKNSSLENVSKSSALSIDNNSISTSFDTRSNRDISLDEQRNDLLVPAFLKKQSTKGFR